MDSYDNVETTSKYYESKCELENVLHEKGEDTIILEAYAPVNMAHLRVLYGVEEDYKESFKNLILIAKTTPGPNGFYDILTKNSKFIIKFLKKIEFTVYTSLLFEMFAHFCEHPNTFLLKICGLYRVTYNLKYHYFMVMFNIYPLKLNENIIKQYHLTVTDTSVSKNEGEQTSDPINHTFENDWPDGITIPSSNIYDCIIDDLKIDFALLKFLNIMDYSIFLSVIKYPHNIENTNSSDPQKCTLMQYVNSARNSTSRVQSHYKNTVIAKTDNEPLIIFMGIIDIPLTIAHTASAMVRTEYEILYLQLEDYENRMIQFITEYVILY